jgi:hypothetical protein
VPFPKENENNFWIQKNRQNGQSITLISDNNHPDIYPVQAAYKIFLRSKRLSQTDKQPMAVFVDKNGKTKYLMGNKISDVLCTFARKVHPDLSEDKIKRFSSHSGRVWALELLDEAGMSPDFCKSRLRWMGESYQLYLRDTLILQQKHVDALNKESSEVVRLLTISNTVPEDREINGFLLNPISTL